MSKFKPKSIQTKILLLVITSVILSAIVIGGVGVLTTKKIVNDDSARLMNLMCSEKALELDTTFSCIEQSVHTLEGYAFEELEDVERFKTDEKYVE